MTDTNLVILNGRLCAEPEFTPRDKTISVKLRLATSYTYLNSKQERVEKTEFHTVRTNITANQLPAWKDRCLKGRRMQVQGMAVTDVVKDEHTNESKYFHFVRAFSNDICLPDPVPRPAMESESRSVSSADLRSESLPDLQRPPQAPGSMRNRSDALNF